MEWIAEVERIDRMLHSAGVPASERNDAMQQIFNALATAYNQRKPRRDVALAAVNRCQGNVREAAKQEGCSRDTIYRLLRTPVAEPTTAATNPRAAFT